MGWIWIVIAVLVVLVGCAGGNKGKAGKQAGPYRIDRMHVIDPDDYECSVCHRRFRKDQMACPCCGTRFSGRVEDSEEFDFEEDELESWDEEEGW